MQDGEVLFHRPVGFHRDGDRKWFLWCDDCDWETTTRNAEAMDRDWRWHLHGAL